MKLLCLDPDDNSYFIGYFLYSEHSQRYVLEWSSWSTSPSFDRTIFRVANTTYVDYKDLLDQCRRSGYSLLTIDSFEPFIHTDDVVSTAKQLYPEYFI